MIRDIGELAARGEFGRVAFRDLDGSAAIQRRAPDRDFRLLQCRIRIGRQIARRRPVGVVIAAPDIKQHFPVRREGELGDLLPIVFGIMRHLTGRIGWCIRHPDIADPTQNAHEGDMAALSIAGGLVDEGIIQHLPHGEVGGRRRAAGCKGQQSQKREQSGSSHDTSPIAVAASLARDLQERKDACATRPSRAALPAPARPGHPRRPLGKA